MSNEIRSAYPTGYNLYALLFNGTNKVWYNTGGVFETHGTSSRTNADYAVSLTEVATGYYTANWPTSMSSGTYNTIIKLRAGSTPANSDATVGGPAEYFWTGTRATAAPEQNAVNICNQSLAKLAGGKNSIKITALGDGTKTSDLCDLLYTPNRKEVLARGYWEEVVYYADLGSESSYSGEYGDWDYVFDLPSNCLRVLKQTHESCIETEYRCEIFQGKLFTNVYTNDDNDSAYIKYVKNETDASVFSQELINCIATKLAAELAPQTLGGETGYTRRFRLLEEFEKLVLPTNESVNQSQQYARDLFRSKFGILGGRSLR